MSIKNTKVRLKDVKAGRVYHTAHPVFGIRSWVATSRPYKNRPDSHGLHSSWWVDTFSYGGNGYVDFYRAQSLRDTGVYGYYNGRRTFRKLKQAQDWMKIHITDPEFQKQHQEHRDFCALHMTDPYDYEEYDDFEDGYDDRDDATSHDPGPIPEELD